jgi:TPR repeat protein
MHRSAEAIYDDETPEQAEALLLPRAVAGDAEAQFFLGHLADEKSPRRPDEALRWYRKAAAAGYSEATHWVASFLFHGTGTEQDIAGALELFREGAMRGVAASQWKLGEHLLQFEESRREGIAWLERSAARGNMAAQELLARRPRLEA